jgi:hypothetical protein
MLYVIRDWLPFAVVLVAYDLSRGAATMIGRPTMWHWQIDADRWMFFGTVPTVWLQERLKLPYPPWWEIVISTVYMSFFILPTSSPRCCGYAIARSGRRSSACSSVCRSRRCHLRAAARRAAVGRRPCTPQTSPAARRSAMHVPPGPRVPDGGLLGAMQTTPDGANGWVERIVGRGWGKLNLQTRAR